MTEGNNKLQNSFVNIILVLLFLTYAAYAYVALRCYAPYNFSNPLMPEAKKALWQLMILPAVVLPIALWLANMLNKKLSAFTLLSVLLTSCFVVAVPKIYSMGEPSEMAYFTSVFVLFFITCSSSAIINELKKKNSASKGIINIIASVLLLLVFMAVLIILALLVFKLRFLYGIGLCVFVPVIATLTLLESLLSVYSKATFILKLASLGIGCLCAGVIDLCTELGVTLFVLFSILVLIWQLIDLGKYIILRRKKNDSESCNA